MKKDNIYLGKSLMREQQEGVMGEFVSFGNERFYRIANYNLMPDFFMTLVSDSDHWLFISSNGSLSAGRKNRDNALFPYYTDDKIHDYCGITGSKTAVFVNKDDSVFLWEPFTKNHPHIYHIERNLYKNRYGNRIIFEEINIDLGLRFRYGWSFSEKYGFVKSSSIINTKDDAISIEIIDGLRNILPSGVDYPFQNEYSNLSDAYKKAELIENTGLALFMLSSIPVDRAEPSESLQATTVWSAGINGSKVLISDRQFDKLLKGYPTEIERDVRAQRGAFYMNAELNLEPREEEDWFMVAEVNQNSTAVANLNLLLAQPQNLAEQVKFDIGKGTENLKRIIAKSDGLQFSREELSASRHLSNTLYNVMRGGIYLDNYQVDIADFKRFADIHNKKLSKKLIHIFKRSDTYFSSTDLLRLAEQDGDRDFLRICYEYLPLTFSRRHGDPSRPWNLFSIENKNDDGTPKLDFQGNWRDIFQNWEALSLSFPGYLFHIISKFLNATTPDGYNPYRIMRDGIDWESPDPEDPWAYIGYWGDHQIIYLQKLLELAVACYPGKLEKLLEKEIFAFANVPYRIKTYDEIIRNPQDTIEFDHFLNEKINKQVEELGADGRLLMDEDGQIHYTNLTEKILITLLAKLSNFIPEAGIWLNTQRPEWNDANNALVGNGVSMVTLYYLRRFVKFWNNIFETLETDSFSLSEEVTVLFNKVNKLFAENTGILKNGFSDKERRHFADVLGEAGSSFRTQLYTRSFSGDRNEIKTRELESFTRSALDYIDQTIGINLRNDGLYHAYNLISFQKDKIQIRYLYEMLEGQVAVLSAGYLTAQQSLEVLEALKSSALFREDQYSYLLYPDRSLPRFIEKNNIPVQSIKDSALLSKLLANKNDTIINADQSGGYHFNGSFRNAEILSSALDKLSVKKYGSLLKKEKTRILELYENMFDHQSFTGRSGTFYGYEGLGSIYWHMVSKLLLATQECYFEAIDEDADPGIIGKLKDHYYEIKAGIGVYKSPELYGAFPTDAYSHTPGNAGVKQPGMTGQVKEDILSRMGELGVRIKNGQITFDTNLLNRDEFTDQRTVFEFIDLQNKKQQLSIHEKQLAFTLCQIPIIYTLSDRAEITISFNDGNQDHVNGNTIDQLVSQMIFNRSGEIQKIKVSIIE